MGIFHRNREEKKASSEFENLQDDAPVVLSSLNNNEKSEEKPINRNHPAVATPKTRSFKYGIEDAIQLMRKLPDVNMDIVVTVVKTTLESTSIQVGDIISDAERKEANIHKRTHQLQVEIADFEKRINKRKDEISRLQQDLEETTAVKEHLMLAEQKEKTAAAAATPRLENRSRPTNTEQQSDTKNNDAIETAPTRKSTG